MFGFPQFGLQNVVLDWDEAHNAILTREVNPTGFDGNSSLANVLSVATAGSPKVGKSYIDRGGEWIMVLPKPAIWVAHWRAK